MTVAGFTNATLETTGFATQGTWTPTIIGSGPVGTATYGVQQGYYRVIGNLVWISASLVWSAGTGGGVMDVANFPFTVSATVSIPPLNCIVGSIAWPASATCLTLNPIGATSQARFHTMFSNGTISNLTYSAAGSVKLSGWYKKS